jgi:hypothetical protein
MIPSVGSLIAFLNGRVIWPRKALLATWMSRGLNWRPSWRFSGLSAAAVLLFQAV